LLVHLARGINDLDSQQGIRTLSILPLRYLQAPSWDAWFTKT